MTEQQTQQKYVCRVCGYVNKRPFYDEMGLALFEICPCCGSESGYHDFGPGAAERNRRGWIQKGAPWHADEWVEKGVKIDQFDLKPENWDLAEQLRRIGVDLKNYQNN